MAEVDPTSRVSCGTVQWRDARGGRYVTAVVKAAFYLEPGLLTPLEAPPMVDADLVPLKASADVIVRGPLSAKAAKRRLLQLGLAQGTRVLLDKCLVALGDEPRLLTVDGGEATFGDVRDGASATPNELIVADDADPSIFQQAPADQRVPFLLGGEQLRLVNLVEGQPDLHCRLPALHPWALLRIGAEPRPVPLVADTLIVDLGKRTVSLIGRGFVRLDGQASSAFVVEGGLLPIQAAEDVRGEPPEWHGRAIAGKAAPFAPVDLLNRSPLSAATFAWKRGSAGWRRTLVVKGTFDIVPGKPATLAASQLPIQGDALDPDGDLVEASDAAPHKPVAEVLLRGNAYRRKDEAVALVTLELGKVKKSVVAIGDRQWTRSGELGDPAPFESIPLTYDRAFGGPGYADNPMGTGLGGSKPPNLERPDRLLRSVDDQPPPAGFGPVPLAWRKGSTGTHDRAWLERAWPGLGDDFDYALFNAAPADQRCPHLRGDEAFSVQRVRPGGETLAGRLPGMAVRAWAQRRGAASVQAVPLVLDTVAIDAEAEQLVLCWRGSLAVADDEASDLAKVLVALGEELDDDMAWALLAGAPKPVRPRKVPTGSVGALLATGLPAPALLSATPTIRDLTLLPAVPDPPSPIQIEQWRDSPAGLKGRDLTGADLRGIDLHEVDLSGALLAHALLDGANLDGAKLTEAILTKASALSTSFRGAKLDQVDATGARLAGANFEGADLGHALLDDANLSAANLRSARAGGASMIRARLDRACLDAADLSAADLTHASLDGVSGLEAVLDEARLYDCTGADVCLDGASLVDGRVERVKLTRLSACDLRARGSVWTDAELSGARLLRSDFEEASFEGAILDSAVASEITAPRARFLRASLVDASLLRADFMQASFEKADLTRADLRGASLYQAETWQARWEGARLEQALVAGTKLKKQ